MRIPISIKRAVLVSVMVLLAVLSLMPTQPVQPTDLVVKGTMVLAPR